MERKEDIQDFDDDFAGLDLPDMDTPEDNFSLDVDDLGISGDDLGIPGDDLGISGDEPLEDKSADDSSAGSKSTIMKKVKYFILLFFVIIIYVWFSSSPDIIIEEGISPTPTPTPIAQNSSKVPAPATMEVKRVKTVIGPNTDFKRAYTLKQINESQEVLQVVEQLKKDNAAIWKKLNQRGDSLRSLRSSQKVVYSALADLSILTSQYDVPLDDGGEVRPSGSGYGYTLISGAGIVSRNTSGIFITVKSGYLITDKSDLSMLFVLRGLDAEKKISNIYKISPIHGLLDRSNDPKMLKNVVNLISNNNPTSKVVVEELNNRILFFNGTGQISARKSYKTILKDESDYAEVVKGSIRMLVGYETNDYLLYDFSSSIVIVDGERTTISGISHGLEARYAEYIGSIEREGRKVIEIMSDGEVIKRIPLSEIESLLLKTATIDNKKYIHKRGNIYMVDVDRQKLLQGKGKILARVDEEQIIDEKIILNETEVKYSNLSTLIGMVLEGKTGKSYQVFPDHIKINPGNEIKLFDDFIISSKSELLSKSKIFIDKILRIRSSTKVGGRITTNTYIIEIRDEDRVDIIEKATKVTQSYNNPKIYFKKEYIVIRIPSIHTIDRKNKTINGKKYISEEVVDRDRSRFVVDGGKYFNIDDPVIRITDVEVLREKVVDIESISGSVFDYVYYVDEMTGKISSSSIGDFRITHKNNKFSVLNSKENKKTIAQIDTKKKKKDVMTFGELMSVNDYFTKVYFKTSNGDTIKINSPSSIVYNDVNMPIRSGKYNNKINLLIISLSDVMSSKERRRLSLSANVKKIERTIESMEYMYDSYYDDDVMVLKLSDGTIVLRVNTNEGVTAWSKVYSKQANIFEGNIKLTIKSINDSTVPTEVVVVKLSNINNITETMQSDMEEEYNRYKAQKLKYSAEASSSQKEASSNKQILTQKLLDINAKIQQILSQNLQLEKIKISQDKLNTYKENKKKKSNFFFEVGTEMSYRIERPIEISEGEELTINATLDQSYFEDREGNTLEMQSPILLIKVTGDFNKSQIIFSPSEIIYTNYDEERKQLSIPADATKMEYVEEETDYILAGVPAYYINQKIRELPTTVMLSTLQGVVDSMTAEDPMTAGLEGLQGLVGDSGSSTTADAFTDGVASGASSGIAEILDVYKAKAQGKADMLISSGKLVLKSVFIKTTPLSEGSTGAQ